MVPRPRRLRQVRPATARPAAAKATAPARPAARAAPPACTAALSRLLPHASAPACLPCWIPPARRRLQQRRRTPAPAPATSRAAATAATRCSCPGRLRWRWTAVAQLACRCPCSRKRQRAGWRRCACGRGGLLLPAPALAGGTHRWYPKQSMCSPPPTSNPSFAADAHPPAGGPGIHSTARALPEIRLQFRWNPSLSRRALARLPPPACRCPGIHSTSCVRSWRSSWATCTPPQMLCCASSRRRARRPGDRLAGGGGVAGRRAPRRAHRQRRMLLADSAAAAALLALVPAVRSWCT